MRISDWSSDVCSSDLLRWARRAGGILLDFCHAHTVVTGAFIRRAPLAAHPISSNMSLMLVAITACMRKSPDTFKRNDAIGAITYNRGLRVQACLAFEPTGALGFRRE